VFYKVNERSADAVKTAKSDTIVIDPRDPRTQSEGVVRGYGHTSVRWPAQPLHKRPRTAAELSGPADLAKRLAPVRGDLAGHGEKRAIGQLIHVRTRVVDEDGAPVPGALVEIWHCNAAGKYIHPNDASTAPADPNFYGAARMAADESGLVELRTIKPAAYAVPDSRGWWRPPHIHFSVWGRTWLSRLVTQMFFPGEPLNEHDAILNAIRDPQARERCVARLAPTDQGPRDALVYEYQIVVRGRRPTPAMP
jgi:protocatechuate 3,4-dioxygenase beta subunit